MRRTAILPVLTAILLTGCATRRPVPVFAVRTCPIYSALEHRTCTRFDHQAKVMVDYPCDVCRVLDDKGYVTPDEPFAVGTDPYDTDGDEGAAADKSKGKHLGFIARLLHRRPKGTGTRPHDDDD